MTIDTLPNVLQEDNFSTLAIDHLGLVADKIDDLGIISFLDKRLPLQAGCGSKVTMGERVAAMILNGLGFIDSRLYMFPTFLEKTPVARLFGKEMKTEWFNDDALGRCLDAISNYGVTKLFTELSFDIGVKKKLLGKSAHFDTSTLEVFGEYSEEQVEGMPAPAFGYSKTKRNDLKQMVINLATTGKANFPIWMESHNGNASDQKIMPDAVKKMNDFCKELVNAPDFMYVGDSALYANILSHSQDLKWLSRVPETLSEAQKLVSTPTDQLSWHALENGYAYAVTESHYGSVHQRWVLIFSEQAYKKELKTLERRISTEQSELETKCWHLTNQLFSCEKDAIKAVKVFSQKIKYHQIQHELQAVMGYDKKGRPQKNEEPCLKGYKIICTVIPDSEKIETAKLRKGRFILSTNQLDKDQLPDSEILTEYKLQSGTESGFKFIKDSAFQVDSIFLKKPNRISALMMIMTLCLMVYGVGQYDLRKALSEKGQTIPSQTKKPTQRPSMKWVYRLFLGVHELTLHLDEHVKTIVVNVRALLKQIIALCGPRAQSIYLNSA